MPSPKIELHNDEVREIMQQIPGWIIRWGLLLVFSIFLIIVLGSYFIKYPETITTDVVITRINPPASLICKTSGKIDKLFVQDGNFVQEGTILAAIQNTTNLSDYYLLKNELIRIKSFESWQEAVLQNENNLVLSVGDMQSSFEQFKRNWNSFRNYLKQGYADRKINILNESIQRQEEYYGLLQDQHKLQLADLQITLEGIKIDSSLFLKGGISEKEMQEANQQLIQKQFSIKNSEANLKNSESSIISLKENILDLEIQYENEISDYKLTLDESLQILENNIKNWEDKYLITSPIDGTLTFSQYWSVNQVVTAGDVFVTVIPDEETQIIGKTSIPSSGIGQVEIGQKVNIKLEGFPYLNFGMLSGRISSISKVPSEGGYSAEIELPEGMKTNYDEQLKFIQEMDGTADIITSEKRVITRFISKIQ